MKVIRFNPVVQKTIISTLKKIADKEALDVAPEKFQEIAENSNGDIRNAINTLQVRKFFSFFFLARHVVTGFFTHIHVYGVT